MKKKERRQLIILGLITLICIGAVFAILKYVRINPSAPPEISATKISAAIIPHHDLAKNLRADLLKKVGASDNYNAVRTVILVSPDHFNAGNSPVTTTDKEWRLENAIVPADKNKIDRLVSSNIVSNQESAFSREHGITNILDDIANDFPNAGLIPIIIKQNVSRETIVQLNVELNNICTQNCLLLASVDFSHYQPGSLAEIHDRLSLRALANLDEELIWKAEVDSQQALALAIRWAKANETQNFHLEENTNSAKLANEPDSESTSYVSGWYQSGEPQRIEDEITFMIGGDAMFGRYIAYKFRNNLTRSIENLGERFFGGTDASIINLEGPISTYPVLINIDPENLVFNFPPETANVLKWLNLNAVSLANNHALNAGYSGLQNTQKVLSQKGIVAIGDPNHLGLQEFSQGNSKLTILTINVSGTSTNISEPIRQAKENNSFVIVFPHWGSEYAQTHNSSQSRLAHQWIDAGADLIVGSHPHVIQDAEIYNNKPIIYSLGNLLFDQTFSRETQQGLVLAGKITDEKLTLVFLPIAIKNYQPELLQETEKLTIINKLKKSLGFDVPASPASLAESRPAGGSQENYGYDMIEITR